MLHCHRGQIHFLDSVAFQSEAGKTEGPTETQTTDYSSVPKTNNLIIVANKGISVVPIYYTCLLYTSDAADER